MNGVKSAKMKKVSSLVKRRSSMNKVTLLGIDLAKNVFQLLGLNSSGQVVFKKRISSREKLINFIAGFPVCTIAMEACGGSNYFARKFLSFGHEIKLIHPAFVKPYVKTNKNDSNDVEGICEAASRPTMRFVTPKTIEQQDIQSLHRIRSGFIEERTALTNKIRGLLMEYGITIAKGIRHIRKLLPDFLEDAENELSHVAREFLNDLYQQLIKKDENITKYDKLLQNILHENEDCKKIEKIEGVGLLTATAVIASIGDAKEFKNGRHLAAFFGLVSRQQSSGNKQKMLGISKRGNSYTRTLLIHGARSAILASSKKNDPKSKWIQALVERAGQNKAAVALANKNAIIIYALIANQTQYQKAG